MSASVRAAGFTITRLQIGSERYTPVIGPDGSSLGPSDLAMLTQLRGLDEAPARRVKFVVADESPPRTEVPQLALARFEVRDPLFLELGDSGLAVGRVEQVWLEAAETIPETTGRAVVAIARLDHSMLADIAWQGIQDQVLRGVCAVAWGKPDENVFACIRFGSLEDSCLAGARILEHWEEPQPAGTA